MLVRELTAKGAEVVEVAAYQSVCPSEIAPEALVALQQQRVNVVTFASSKTVRNFCQLVAQAFGSDWRSHLTGICIASIGPQTSKACETLLGRVDVEAREYTLEGLTKAVIQWVNSHPSQG